MPRPVAKKTVLDISISDSDVEAPSAPPRGPAKATTSGDRRRDRYNTHSVKEALGLGLGRQKQTKTKFTLEEDMRLIRYVCNEGITEHHGNLFGYAVIMGFCLENPQIAERHPEQSLRERLKTIRKNIDKFDIKSSWKEMLRFGANASVKKEELSKAQSPVVHAKKPVDSVKPSTSKPQSKSVVSKKEPDAPNNRPARKSWVPWNEGSIHRGVSHQNEHETEEEILLSSEDEQRAKAPRLAGVSRPAKPSSKDSDRIENAVSEQETATAAVSIGKKATRAYVVSSAAVPSPTVKPAIAKATKDAYRAMASRKEEKNQRVRSLNRADFLKMSTHTPKSAKVICPNDSDDDIHPLRAPRAQVKSKEPKLVTLCWSDDSDEDADDGLENVVKRKKEIPPAVASPLRSVRDDREDAVVVAPVGTNIPPNEVIEYTEEHEDPLLCDVSDALLKVKEALQDMNVSSAPSSPVSRSRSNSSSPIEESSSKGPVVDDNMDTVEQPMPEPVVVSRRPKPCRDSRASSPEIAFGAPRIRAATDVNLSPSEPHDVEMEEEIADPPKPDSPTPRTMEIPGSASSTSTTPSPQPDLAKQYRLMRLLAKQLDISKESTVWALFVNNGSPLMTVKWMVNKGMHKNGDPTPTLEDDLFVLKHAEQDPTVLVRAVGWTEPALLERLAYLREGQREMVKTDGGSLEDMLRQIYKHSFVPPDLTETDENSPPA